MKRKIVLKEALPVEASKSEEPMSGIASFTGSNEKISSLASKSEQIDLIEHLIKKEIVQCAIKIDVSEDELQAWIDLQTDANKTIPSKSILHLLRTAREYQLDPLKEEVLLVQYENYWQIMISIDGWIKLINRHPAFTGISFQQSSEETQGLPIWTECTITRADRTMPITIREYLAEVRKDSDYWKKMPRRMLRHKAMQQCARIALAITVTDEQLEKRSSVSTTSTLRGPNSILESRIEQTQIEKLKSLLVKNS